MSTENANIEQTILGKTGVPVSRLCFGTMSFGGDADEAMSAMLYAACRDKGINFFDCANVYSLGKAEEILGRLMAHERDDLFITSKCWGAMSDDVLDQGSNRRHIKLAVEASLKRLNTDRLDLLFLHHWDANTPLEESLRALEDLVRDGKVIYTGCSNHAAWQIMKGLGISERQGWSSYSVIQPMYNLVKRQAEAEILPMAASENLGVISYSPLGGGLLSGKYGRDKSQASDVSAGRLNANKMYNTRYGEDRVYEQAAAVSDVANELGVHPVSLAVSWVEANPAITAPIIGARNVEQLEPALKALDAVDMTEELYARLSSLTTSPYPATDRLEEA